MVKGYRIRRAQLRDAEAIASVSILSWQETYEGLMPNSFLSALETTEGQRRRDGLRKRLTTDPDGIAVAEREGRIVGFVSARESRDEPPVTDGEIQAIYLLKDHHGRGVGRALFEEGLSILNSLGMKSASLWVLAGNRTEGFYKHMGGLLNGERKDREFGGTPLVERRYVWGKF